MRTSSVKTVFHILGAVFSIIAFFLLMAGLFPSPYEENPATLIPLTLALVLMGMAVYSLAGAPYLTRAIKRRFPDEGRPKRSRSNPRHKLKASIGITLGFVCALLPWSLTIPGFDSQDKLDKFGETFLAIAILAPLISTWGAAHLAWLRQQSPMIPIVVGAVGFVVALLAGIVGVLVAIIGYVLMTVSPVLVVVLSPSRQRLHR